MTPIEAAQALRDLERYEEALTRKAAGLTTMVFGIAGTGIFVTYGAVSSWALQSGLPWLLAFLWAPWIAAAATTAQGIWTAQAVSLKMAKQGRGIGRTTLGFVALFFAIAGLLVLANLGFDLIAVMTLAVGIFTVATTAFFGKRQGDRRDLIPGFAGGLMTVGLGIVLGLTHLPFALSTLTGAGGCGTVYFLIGVFLYRRG